MTLQLLYWILLLLWLVLGLWSHWPAASGGNWRPAGGSILEFLLFLIIGWAVFGAPVK